MRIRRWPSVTLGDVSVYSTATYVRQKLENLGYKTEVIPGKTTFINAAARAGISLCETMNRLLCFRNQNGRIVKTVF